MPVLKNARHEKFAQELAKGKTADEAYQLAGFKPNRGNASVLKQKESISNRVAEILKQAEENDRKANERVIEKLAITKERVAAELAKIAFLDIREAVRWGRSPVDTESENANPNGLGIYPVELVPSDQISDEAAAAVSEVSLTQNGVKIKMHDKRAALMDLAKLMGFVIEKNEVTGKDGGPIQTETRTWREVLRDEKKG
ncbi:terminase small subunit [Sinorhizobium meliloti]|jgi:phage terminase small subunit|uniref:terminase small subunit n=1 Tax=Rhizobium meliloti TaxID=382 RepID=UPI0020BF5D23|nr:terminase small subunit [Sinorhizobium meliloti]MDE3809945.1 terminase small subunit [Sinorhizobium meliloti]